MANSEYLLKFKANPAVDDAFISCTSFEAAVSEVEENANELEWALLLSGIPSLINAKDVTRWIIETINYRELHPDWKEREEGAARRELADRRSAYYSQVM